MLVTAFYLNTLFLESGYMKVILVFLIHEESFITIRLQLVAIPINCIK